MEQSLRLDQIPKQARSLYIYLYCKRKGECGKRVKTEAVKSWVTLAPAKRKLFCKTILDRNLLEYAYGLNKTKPFLKQKCLSILNKNTCKEKTNDDRDSAIDQANTIVNLDESDLTEHKSELLQFTGISDNTENNITNSETDLIDKKIPENEVSIRRLSSETSPRNYEDSALDAVVNTASPSCGSSSPIQDCERENELECQDNASNVPENIPLVEPLPPTVKKGKDLYEVIKTPGSASWKEIGIRERSQYNSAVRIIKREYIKNYTKYLESLSQKQLYDHYVKTFH